MSVPWSVGMFQTAGIMGAWQLPENTSTDFLDLQHWIDMARSLDAAGVDFLFFADDYGYPLIDGRLPAQALRSGLNFPRADPMAIIPALAAVTERLGLVVTLSTTVEKPPMIARRMATLDHLTKGRIGWNIVTGAGQIASARLFGDQLVPHDERYAIADEHVALTLRLWQECWDDDGLVVDRARNLYADPDRVREIHHHGSHFRADGILTTPPGPQRTPVLFQAGASAPGRELAAKYAEGVFIAAEVPAMRAQIADIRRRAEAYGRDPQSIKCLVAGTFRVGESEQAARVLQQRTEAVRTLADAAAQYAFFTGLDLSRMDPDRPLDATANLTDAGRTNVERFLGPGAPTVRQILEEFQRNSVMGSPLIGDPAQVVDQAEEVIGETGADGFLVQPDAFGTFTDFTTMVLPEMHRRGLVRAALPGTTLRERFSGRPRLAADHPGVTAHTTVPALV
ncbi:NtaA/DmoA family FMN-dependent monooxygenase [Nakamurella leprariae]|uniref:NtaA/DmoA family FMN-dependent monooxygenase n=1 Tax=Nakamurella leprariae TaxID=2803911 RepID=A0A938YH89_9ACTN|nr:NtaA/DmoA family FMN-dependent monooxygenase [Nakamurella leprariae]MBM9469573.1 NtaA/DmoA family FMN-dependent monooxygenase [Nakamurella leprariae]